MSASSSRDNSISFPRAVISWSSAKSTSPPRPAWLAITTAVRWKYITSPNEQPPVLLSAFRGQHCVAVERLSDDKEWKAVEQAIRPVDSEHGHAFVIPGRLLGHGSILRTSRTVKLIVASDSVEQRNAWLHAVRVRISPWILLYRRFRDTFLDAPHSFEFIRKMFNIDDKLKDQEKARLPQRPGEMVNEESLVSDGVETLTGFIDTVATAVKVGVPYLKDTAESVSDVAKCVSVLSSAVTVVVLCATLVEMGMEVRRGEKELPLLHSAIEGLREKVVESMVLILHPDGDLKEELVKDVFETQECLFDVLARIEDSMMRRGVARFWKAAELKRIEQEVNNLKRCVVRVVQSGSIANNSKRITALEQVVNPREIPQMRYRPEVIRRFVGREEELCMLKRTLVEHGCAVVTSFGGLGKTQLVAAFAERAERDGLVPGGSYWFGAHGKKPQVIHSLAEFTESLTGKPLREDDRNNVPFIVATLRRKLQAVKENWFLCIDNADDPEVNPIVGKILSLSRLTQGWVVVTSRQGVKTLWDEVTPDQMIRLEPLGLKQAMIALMRWKHHLFKENISDDGVMERVEQLEKQDPRELRALSELAGDDETYGLAGHPLAVAQAGSFICRLNVSFSQYIAMYSEKRHCESVSQLFHLVEDDGLEQEYQRSVWLTFKINIDNLSNIAHAVLRRFALFDSLPVPYFLFQCLDERFVNNTHLFLEIVRGELANGASLIQENGNDTSSNFTMHRLIREYVVTDLMSDEQNCSEAVHHTLTALHNCCERELKAAGHTFENHLWDACTKSAQKLLPLVSVLLNSFHDTRMKSHFLDKSDLLIDLRRFAMYGYKFLGRYRDAELAAKSWYELLILLHGGTNHEDIADALTEKGCISYLNGSNEDALNHLREALALYEKVYGDDTDDVGISRALHLMGSVLRDKGLYVEAEKYFLESLEMDRGLYGEKEDSEDIADTLHELGTLALLLGNYDEAQMRYEEALYMNRRVNKENADLPQVAATMHELGQVMLAKGLPDKAEEWFQESLEMKRRIHGHGCEHPSIAQTLYQLGRVYDEKLEYDEAGNWYRQSLEMSRKIHDSDGAHPDLAAALHGLGRVARGKGNYDDAKNWYGQSLVMERNFHGENADHVSIATTIQCCGVVDYEIGRHDDAEKSFHECLSMLYRIFGNKADHPDIARIFMQLGRVNKAKGKEEAQMWFIKSFKMNERLGRHERNQKWGLEPSS